MSMLFNRRPIVPLWLAVFGLFALLEAAALKEKAQDRIAELEVTCSRDASPSPRV
jgi:uncharacterized membrane protein